MKVDGVVRLVIAGAVDWKGPYSRPDDVKLGVPLAPTDKAAVLALMAGLAGRVSGQDRRTQLSMEYINMCG